MRRWGSQGLAALLVVVLPLASCSIHELLSFRDLFGSIRDSGYDLVIAWGGTQLLHLAYWTSLAILAVAVAVIAYAAGRRLRRSAAAAILLIAAAVSLVVTPVPVIGPFVYRGGKDSGLVSWDAQFVVAIGCWVVVAVGALVLAVRTWRVQPSGGGPRP